MLVMELGMSHDGVRYVLRWRLVRNSGKLSMECVYIEINEYVHCGNCGGGYMRERMSVCSFTRNLLSMQVCRSAAGLPRAQLPR